MSGGKQYAERQADPNERGSGLLDPEKNICEGQYPPGFWLQENELCEQLGVSRSPVREALRRLVSDGLVISIPNKGTFVKEFTCKDIDEIFDMRVMLEGYAIRNSRANLTSAHIQQLLDLLDRMETTFQAGDLEEYTSADEQLHNEIVTLGNNSIVSSTYYRVGSMNQQFRVLSLSVHQRFEESLGEHKQIIHALIEGDTLRAERLNQQHLELARECIKEQLEKKQAKS